MVAQVALDAAQKSVKASQGDRDARLAEIKTELAALERVVKQVTA